MGFAMADDVLIYSLSEHRDLIFALFEAAAPSSVVEIGSEAGGMTREMCAWVSESGGARSFTAVEPFPVVEVRSLAASVEGFTLVEGRSPETLSSVPPADAYLIDGDHNYWTVSRELEAVYADGRAPLAVLHDVGWPCARRDQYYAPERIPESERQSYTYEGGIAPGNPGVDRHGFRGAGVFAVAEQEGGPRNGVLTAVEDFVAETDGLTFRLVPCVFGLGFLYAASAPWAEALDAHLAPYDRSPLLERLEDNRIALYLQVLRLQDELDRRAGVQAQVVSGLRRRVAELEARLGDRDPEPAA
jgi:hypothetical protein